MKASSLPRARGFTLIELLVCVAIIGVLVTIIVAGVSYARNAAAVARSVHQMRQIYAGIVAYATQNDGVNYTVEQVGNSSYRSADDPLGLPQLLEEAGVMPAGEVWMNPAGRPSLRRYGNNYCWNRSSGNFCGKPMAAIPNPTSVAVLWDNYCYTLPSIRNVAEVKAGPPVAPSAYYRNPFEGGTGSMFLYADGHAKMNYIKVSKK